MTDDGNIVRLAELQEGRALPPPSQPMAVARIFIDEEHLVENALTLRHWRGAFWLWRKTLWAELENGDVRSRLYNFTEHAIYMTNDGPAAWAPTRHKVANVLEALAAICILPSDIDQPAWLNDTTTDIIVSVANGLLDIERRHLLPHTPNFFNQTAVPTWCEESEHPKLSKALFGRDLRAAVPSVRKTRPRDGSERHYVYAGIKLRS